MDLYVNVKASTPEINESSWVITVKNNGTATAYGVVVDLEFADQLFAVADETTRRSAGFRKKDDTSCSGDIPGTTCLSGTLHIGTLETGEEKVFSVRPKLTTGLTCCTSNNDQWIVPARAVVTNTFPVENERFKANNTDIGWIRATTVTGQSPSSSDYWLQASVDNLLPDAGDTLTFTFKAGRGTSIGIGLEGIEGSIPGAKIRFKLDDGMGTPTATPPTGTNFGSATGLTRTWDWDFDLKHPVNSRTLEVSTRLDNPLPSGVDRSNLCMTAELTVPRPYDNKPGDTSAEICLREDAVILFQEGDTHLFAYYPCVDVSAYPCTTSGGLELLVNGGEAARVAGIGRDESVLDPEKVVVHVPDQNARHIDGSDITWRTPDAGSDGVTIGDYYDNISSSTWSTFTNKLTVTDAGGGTKPGSMQLCTPNCNTEFIDADAGDFGFTYNANSSFTTNLVAVFGALGTYVAERITRATHNNNTVSTADDVVYEAKGVYTFHVGPLADLELSAERITQGDADELEVRLVAANHGPDHAIAPEVRLTLPYGVSVVQATPVGVPRGTFNRSTNTWELDDGYTLFRDSQGNAQRGMCFPDYCHAAGLNGEAALTLRLRIDPNKASIDTLTLSGKIVSAGEYVAPETPNDPGGPCLKKDSTKPASGANCHTGNVYDWNPDNSSFRLELRKPVAPRTEPRRISRNELHRAQLCSGWLPSRGDGYTSVGGENQHLQVEWYSNPHTFRYCMGEKGWHWMPLAWFQAQGVSYREGVEYRFSLDEAKSLRVEFMDTNYNYHQYRRSGQLIGPGDAILYRLAGETQAGTLDQIYQYQKELGVRIDPEEATGIGALLGPRVVVNRCLGPGDYRLRVQPWQPWEFGSGNYGFERTVHHVARFSWTTAEGADCPADVVAGQAGPTGQAYGEAQQLQANRAPEFRDGASTTREVAENSPAGTNVGSPVAAADPDVGDTLTYFLSGDDAASFEIDRNTGQITTTSGVTYDYETQSSYSLLVDVSDGNGAWDGIQVTVNLTNVDETVVASAAEPVFSTPPADQTATAGAAFSYTPEAATDAQNDPITYAASLDGGGALPGWLSFDPSSRTFAGTPQVCDAPARLPITITASDGETPAPNTGTASFTLTVNGATGGPAWHQTVSKAYYEEYARENGHLGEGGNPDPAYYNRPPLFLEGVEATRSLAENSAADVKVGGPVLACDPDGDPLLYKWLDGPDSANFALDEDTGQLTTVSGQTYDYDTKDSYEFYVIVEEQGTAELYLSAIRVTVNLSDDN